MMSVTFFFVSLELHKSEDAGYKFNKVKCTDERQHFSTRLRSYRLQSLMTVADFTYEPL